MYFNHQKKKLSANKRKISTRVSWIKKLLSELPFHAEKEQNRRLDHHRKKAKSHTPVWYGDGWLVFADINNTKKFSFFFLSLSSFPFTHTHTTPFQLCSDLRLVSLPSSLLSFSSLQPQYSGIKEQNGWITITRRRDSICVASFVCWNFIHAGFLFVWNTFFSFVAFLFRVNDENQLCLQFILSTMVKTFTLLRWGVSY